MGGALFGAVLEKAGEGCADGGEGCCVGGNEGGGWYRGCWPRRERRGGQGGLDPDIAVEELCRIFVTFASFIFFSLPRLFVMYGGRDL